MNSITFHTLIRAAARGRYDGASDGPLMTTKEWFVWAAISGAAIGIPLGAAWWWLPR